ncbi:MAG: ion transporter [Alphaproteobacteria bacterium]
MENNRNNFRYKIWRQLKGSAITHERPSFINIVIIFLIIAMIAILAIRSEPNLSSKLDNILKYIQAIIWICFMIEWLARCWTSVENERFNQQKYPRLQWFKQPENWLDFIAIFPGLLLIWSGSSNVIYALRLFRLFILVRFFRFVRRSRSFYFLAELFRRQWRELVLSLSFLTLLVYIMACLIWLAEHHINPDFSSIAKSFWWAVVSITTVGYGDVVPVTTLGKFITGSFLLISMAFVALPGAIMAAGFIALLQEEKQNPRKRYKRGK